MKNSPISPEKTLSQKLRDIFASIGLCESTSDIARRPDVISAIISNSAGYGQADGPVTPISYKNRLAMVLNCAAVSTLDHIAQDDIVVCLDQRQSRAEIGFFDSVVLSAFYIDGDQKIISLYDHGKTPGIEGFFEHSMIAWAGDALDKMIHEHIDDAAGTMLGTTHARYNPILRIMETKFEWHPESDFAKVLEKNPDLRTPPKLMGGDNGQTPPSLL